jgi:uncharacterized coiled-coil DUF342 family protein
MRTGGASQVRRQIDGLRAELHRLYESCEKTGSAVRRMEEISDEIRQLQEGRGVRKTMEAGPGGDPAGH